MPLRRLALIASHRLEGKSVIVTGAARGQGASHTERLAVEGARVLAGDVLDPEGKATAQQLQEAGLDVEYVHLDVTSADDWARAVDQVCTATGRLDVLVNNAGIIHVNPLLDEQPEDWHATFAVNTTGPLLAPDARERWRLDHQRRVDLRSRRRCGVCRVLREQGRADRPHQVGGARTGR